MNLRVSRLSLPPSLPFQRLPDVAGEKMFVSGPFFPSVRLLINMLQLLLLLGPADRWLLVAHQELSVSEKHPSVRFSLFNERTTGEDKGCPALPFTGLTGDNHISIYLFLTRSEKWYWWLGYDLSPWLGKHIWSSYWELRLRCLCFVEQTSTEISMLKWATEDTSWLVKHYTETDCGLRSLIVTRVRVRVSSKY